MSEYQYYEFRAVDRPLDEAAMDHLGTLSSRAEITRTSFTNTYHYGDFRGSPDALMDRYFDAFVYVSNWGTNRLMLRVPRRFLDADAVIPYTDDDHLTVRTKGQNVILEFSTSNDDGDGEWVEGERWMDSLIGLRDELLRGDHRGLYLGWLASFRGRGWLVEDGSDFEDPADDEEHEPPCPPGLGKLSGSLESLAEFLGVDADLIAVAAAGNPGEVAAGPSSAELGRWIGKLPAAEKDRFLLRFATAEGDIPLRAELLQCFRASTRSASAVGPPRPVTQLLLARAQHQAEARKSEAERKLAERARRDREAAEARVRHLDALAPREGATWAEVEALVASKVAKNYDRAVDLLVDLRDLAARAGHCDATEARVRALRQRFANLHSFLRRLDAQALGR